MSDRKKGIMAGIVIVAVIVGLNVYAAKDRIQSFISGWNYTADELMDRFWEKAEEKYGNDGKKARVIQRNNDDVFVLVCYAEGEEEGYYEIYIRNWEKPDEVSWKGKNITKKTFSKADGQQEISVETEGRPTQWVYIFFPDAEDTGFLTEEDGAEETIKILQGKPFVTIQECSPEHVRIIKNKKGFSTDSMSGGAPVRTII